MIPWNVPSRYALRLPMAMCTQGSHSSTRSAGVTRPSCCWVSPRTRSATRAIRAGGLPRKQMTLGELADVLGGYRMGRFHGDESCFLPTTFDGYQDRCFSFRTTPALASRPSPAYESVVQLHEAVNQRVKIASFGGKTASNITTRPSHNHRIYHAYPVDSPDHYR